MQEYRLVRTITSYPHAINNKKSVKCYCWKNIFISYVVCIHITNMIDFTIHPYQCGGYKQDMINFTIHPYQCGSYKQD
jgi:hypothetical protein